MEGCDTCALDDNIPLSSGSIGETEPKLRRLLGEGKDRGLCALIRVELDRLPDSDESYDALCDRAGVVLARFFAPRSVIAHSGSAFLIFTRDLGSRGLARLRLGQLCDFLRFPYEQNGSAVLSCCAAGIVMWDSGATRMFYDSLSRAALDALNQQRSNSLQGYMIMEADADGVFRKKAGDLVPAVLLDEMGIGLVLLQGPRRLTSAYHNSSCARLLQLPDDCCDEKSVSELFCCLLEQDRVALETLISVSASSLDLAELTCRLKTGGWLTIRLMPVLVGSDMPVSILVSLSRTTPCEESGMEAKLEQKKLELLAGSGCLSTFEVDIASRSLTLSPELQHLYSCRCSRVENVPERCCGCRKCIHPSSWEAYCRMFENIYAGNPGGEAEVLVGSRLTGDYIPAKLTWRSVCDERGRAVKAVGVVNPLVTADEDDSNSDVAKLQAELSLQDEYFRRSGDSLKALRRYRHDFKNYIIALTGYLRENRTQEALDFLAMMGDDLRKSTPLVNTGNPIIDAIISEKLGQAIKSGVSVDQLVGLRPDLDFDMMDLCLAVACCLDNALDASKKVLESGGVPYIEFKLVEQRDVIVMKLVNGMVSSDDDRSPQTATTKSDKVNHGFGLQNVRSVVEKHNGSLILTKDNGRYITAFTLFM